MSEELLIEQCRDAIDECAWSVGLRAIEWSERHAKGRELSALAAVLRIPPDGLENMRNVAARFFNRRHAFPMLHWNHFSAVIEDDEATATALLEWANGEAATVAEMKAFKRSHNW